MSFEKVAETSDLWIGEMRQVKAGGRQVLLVRLDQGFFAYDDRCPHLGSPLTKGALDGSLLTCAAHGWSFDLTTGMGVNPRSCLLQALPVRVTNDGIWLDAGPL